MNNSIIFPQTAEAQGLSKRKQRELRTLGLGPAYTRQGRAGRVIYEPHAIRQWLDKQKASTYGGPVPTKLAQWHAIALLDARFFYPFQTLGGLEPLTGDAMTAAFEAAGVEYQYRCPRQNRGPWVHDDHLWFAAHRGRNHRLRLALGGEIEAPFGRGEPEVYDWIFVRQLRPGLHLYLEACTYAYRRPFYEMAQGNEDYARTIYELHSERRNRRPEIWDLARRIEPTVWADPWRKVPLPAPAQAVPLSPDPAPVERA
ncbi:MAG: hypothetical protein M3Z21_14805 [Pseudomonadota bacterium]|nr:hypothetical protein [Pseudomonadota bacterium]